MLYSNINIKMKKIVEQIFFIKCDLIMHPILLAWLNENLSI